MKELLSWLANFESNTTRPRSGQTPPPAPAPNTCVGPSGGVAFGANAIDALSSRPPPQPSMATSILVVEVAMEGWGEGRAAGVNGVCAKGDPAAGADAGAGAGAGGGI